MKTILATWLTCAGLGHTALVNAQQSDVSPRVQVSDSAPSGDGVYGRFDGDLDLGVRAGVEAADTTSFSLGLSAHHFSTAGAFLRHAEALKETETDSLVRRTELGVELRPLFIPRWASDLQGGGSLLDLTLDSLALGMGVYFAQPTGGSHGDVRGFSGSMGFGVPLFGQAQGLWLEVYGLGRWRDDGGDAESAALFMLSWHQLVVTGLTAP